MSPLEQLRADQHDDVVMPSDAALSAYLAEADPEHVRRDLEPRSAAERRHLSHARRNT